jgi:uncharacterized membrane protein (DUF485 family)
VISRHARYGLILFFLYVLLYAGFIAISVLSPDLMNHRPMGGVNLAILYGLGLILAAFILAMVYMALCRRKHTSASDPAHPSSGDEA